MTDNSARSVPTGSPTLAIPAPRTRQPATVRTPRITLSIHTGTSTGASTDIDLQAAPGSTAARMAPPAQRVRCQPRHDTLTQIQDPVITMHSSSLRIVEVSESLRHSQRLGNIVRIKRRNYLPLGLVEGIVERIALPKTRIAVKDLDPWISLGISSTDLQGPVYRLILDNDHLQVLSRIFQTDQ